MNTGDAIGINLPKGKKMDLLKEESHITPDIINELVSGKNRVIKIPNFYSEKAAAALVERMLTFENQSKENCEFMR